MTVAPTDLLLNRGTGVLKARLQQSEEIFRRTGRCFGIDRLSLKEQDPLKYELFHSRLLSTVISAREMARQISSSVMTREEGELSFALYTPEGDSIVFSTGIMVHIGVMGKFIKWMINNDYEADPGIAEGDHFANNDVLIAAVHVPDVYFATPICHEGQVIGWSSGVTHVLEVGSITPGGGMSDLAVERQLEGIHICAEKVAMNDHLRRDYELRIQRNTRLASFWLLDDRARIAGNVFIREEVKRIIEEFGLDYYQQATRELVEEGRLDHLARVKEKLVPGRYRSPGFGDVLLKGKPGVLPHANKDSIIHLPLQVDVGTSGTITLDLDGTSPWGFHNFNAPPAAIEGGLSITDAQILDFDGKANDGCLKNIVLNLPLGTLANPDYDFVATGFAWGTLINLFNCFLKATSRGFYSRGYVEEVLTGGNVSTAMEFGGINQYGFQTGGVNVEMTASAGGARGVMDGIDAAWSLWNPEGDQGNAEMWELLYPILYLGRRALQDSGSPGRYRGGMAFEGLWMICNTDFAFAYQIPGISKFTTNYGIYGGYGGAVAYVNVATNNNLQERIARQLPLPHGEGNPSNPDIRQLLKGDLQASDGHYITDPLKHGDLYEKPYTPGGSGFGDPLDRDPTLVESDLNVGLVSEWAASTHYGVVAHFDPASKDWKVDAAATAARRAELKKARLQRGVPVKDWWQRERARVQRGEFVEPLTDMYRGCMRLSKRWREEFWRFWALPIDSEFPG